MHKIAEEVQGRKKYKCTALGKRFTFLLENVYSNGLGIFELKVISGF